MLSDQSLHCANGQESAGIISEWSDRMLSLYLSVQQGCRYEGEFDDNFSYFSSKPYAVTPYLNRLVETVQMRGHSICFYVELSLIIINYSLPRALSTYALKALDLFEAFLLVSLGCHTV